jgi:hypothetical protein
VERERFTERCWKESESVFLTLGVPHDYVAGAEIDVLDAQPSAFEQSEP